MAKFKELNWGMKKEKREVFVALSLKSLHRAADLIPIFGLGLSQKVKPLSRDPLGIRIGTENAKYW